MGDETSITLDEEGTAAATAIRTKGGGQQPGGEPGSQGQRQKSESVDNEGKTVTIQGTDGTVYEEGGSAYTVRKAGEFVRIPGRHIDTPNRL